MAKSSSAACGRRWPRAIAGLIGLGLAAGCGPVTRAPSARAPAPPPVAAGPERILAIDPRRSEIRVLVFRGGALAFLGHNHVLVARGLQGEVRERLDGSGGQFAVDFEVAQLAIDEPAARREAGPEFVSEPSAADVAGTRQNLLGPAQLDAGAFPRIRIRGRVAAAPAAVEAAVELCGRVVPLTIRALIAHEGAALIATGELPLSQAMLGLTPFSAVGGALQVRDQLQVRFRIVAAAAGTG